MPRKQKFCERQTWKCTSARYKRKRIKETLTYLKETDQCNVRIETTETESVLTDDSR